MTATREVIDLFAGAGGWDEGLRQLGITSVLGIELDPSACDTARAAGHERVQADVAALSPADFPCRGLVGSPPCPTFSAAGKGAGRVDGEHVVACALDLAAGSDTRALHLSRCEDERSMLTVEPLRWALALMPEWVALEQVPPVLPIWSLFAQLLAARGYSAWAGVLRAEEYGVPQTRKRAILMASRTHAVCPPRASHQRYVPGEPQRHDITLVGEVLPWVSMAEALGRDAQHEWRNGTRANAAVRPSDHPAPTIHFGSSSNEVSWFYDRWVAERPATTVSGDPRISRPGRHDPEESGSQQRDAVRVTVEEAAVLQGFRADYPWRGSKTRRFQQVGNAVPPPFARAVLAGLIGRGVGLERAA